MTEMIGRSIRILGFGFPFLECTVQIDFLYVVRLFFCRQNLRNYFMTRSITESPCCLVEVPDVKERLRSTPRHACHLYIPHKTSPKVYYRQKQIRYGVSDHNLT